MSFSFASSLASFSIRHGDIRRTITQEFQHSVSQKNATRPEAVGVVMAAVVVCIIEIVNCMSVAVILRGTWPNELIDPLFRHVVYGFILSQMIASLLSRVPGVITGSSFENLVIFGQVRDIIVQNMEDYSPKEQVVTFLVCVAVSTLISTLLLATLSIPKFTKLLQYLPDHVRNGVFMAIGVGVFMLGFDSFELQPFDVDTWTTGAKLLKWGPAYAIGLGLWYIGEHYPSRFLLLGFIISCIVGVHASLFVAGMSPHNAVSGGWLLGELEARPFSEFFTMTYGSFHLVDVQIVAKLLPQICAASFIGPVLNVSINLLVLEGMLDIKNLSYPKEFMIQALGHFVTSLGFGFNAYTCCADTAILHKAGGTNGTPNLLMCVMLVCVCVIPPIMPLLTITIPVLLPATIFVFLGIDIVLGVLSDMKESSAPMEFSFALLTCCICCLTSIPVGMLCACAVCAVQKYTMVLPELQNHEIKNMRTPTGSIVVKDGSSSHNIQLCVSSGSMGA